MDSEFSGRVVPDRPARCVAARRLGVRAAVLALTFGLAACVGYAPVPLVPQDVLGSVQQRATQDVQVPGSGSWGMDWFPLEADVRLEDGVSLAEANALALFFSPALRIARADARVAGAQVLQAGVLQNPQLFVGPRISTRNAESIFPVNLNWQLPLWGARDAERDEARAELSARRLDVIQLELDTLYAVRAAFLRMERLRRERDVLERVLAASDEVVAWVERLLESGEVDAADLFLARMERDEVAAGLERQRLEATTQRRELLELLGLLPGAPVEFGMEGASALPPLRDTDPDVLMRVPSLRAAEEVYAAAEARLRLEIARQYPGINLGAQFESDRGDPMVGPGVTVDLPLFDRNLGNIAAAEEARDRARESYEQLLVAAAHREARARDEARAAEQVLVLYRGGALRDVEEAARSLDVRLRTGRADVVEVLAAQRAVGNARARLLQLEEEVAAARLRAAVAGGLALPAPEVDEQEANQ